MQTITESTTAERLSRGLVRILETGEGAEEVFAPDVVFDINVPAWRFQVRGAGPFADWWHQEVDRKGRARVEGYAPTSDGFALETSIEFSHHGHALYARQVLIARVAGDRIGRITLYCTGDWDAETRARQAAEAPMIEG